MRQNRGAIIIGVIGVILTVIGVADILTTDVVTIVEGEKDTISYYLLFGVLLIVFSVITVVRGNRRIK